MSVCSRQAWYEEAPNTESLKQTCGGRETPFGIQNPPWRTYNTLSTQYFCHHALIPTSYFRYPHSTTCPYSLLQLPSFPSFLLQPSFLYILLRSTSSSIPKPRPYFDPFSDSVSKMASFLNAEMPVLDPNHARIVEGWLSVAAQRRRHTRKEIAVQSPEAFELAREAQIGGLNENTHQVLRSWYAKKLKECLEIEQQTLHRFQRFAVECAESSRDPARTVALYDQVKGHLRCLCQTQIVYMYDVVGDWFGWMKEVEKMKKASPTNFRWRWKKIFANSIKVHLFCQNSQERRARLQACGRPESFHTFCYCYKVSRCRPRAPGGQCGVQGEEGRAAHFCQTSQEQRA